MKSKITTSQKIWQWIFTILLLSFIWGFLVILFEEVTDDYRGDRSLAVDLNSGKYGQCMDFYYILESSGEVDDPVYDQYREFVEFYENYMYYIQYNQYENRFGTGEYEEECSKCMTNMKEIAGNTTFFENEQHYEYLFTTLEKVQD